MSRAVRRSVRSKTHCLTAVTLFFLLTVTSSRGVELIDRVDWPTFMARNDLVWNRPPDRWESGAFMGNGLLGANVFTSEDSKQLKWHIGRSDVVDRGARLPRLRCGHTVSRLRHKPPGWRFCRDLARGQAVNREFALFQPKSSIHGSRPDPKFTIHGLTPGRPDRMVTC